MSSGSASALRPCDLYNPPRFSHGDDIRVIGAERLLVYRKRALVQRLGLGVAALRAVEFGEVVERGAHRWVLGTQRLLADRERALEELPRRTQTSTQPLCPLAAVELSSEA